MGKECERTVVAMENRALEEEELLLYRKKRKCSSDLDENECEEVLVKNFASPAASRTSGCCKVDESNDCLKESLRAPDLENFELKLEGFEREISTSSIVGCFSGVASPASELCGDSEEVLMDSASAAAMPAKKQSTPSSIPRRKYSPSYAEKPPSAAELEEFFTTAEMYDQKRFAEKYNYDIVKDVPLEGKYHWVRL